MNFIREWAPADRLAFVIDEPTRHIAGELGRGSCLRWRSSCRQGTIQQPRPRRRSQWQATSRGKTLAMRCLVPYFTGHRERRASAQPTQWPIGTEARVAEALDVVAEAVGQGHE